MYSIGGIYRHPDGNISHFVSALELLLNDLDNGKTTIIAGDMNIDIIRFTNIDVISYMTTMMANKNLPYITLPSRITLLSTTCINHIFMKKPHKAKILNTLCGLFYCDISDHLPSFLSLKFEKYDCVSERPMTRIFGERNCRTFIQLMESENFSVTENDWYIKFLTIMYGIYQQSFPLVRVSRKRWLDKTWITKALKISIKN